MRCQPRQSVASLMFDHQAWVPPGGNEKAFGQDSAWQLSWEPFAQNFFWWHWRRRSRGCCFRLVKACPDACVCQPTMRSLLRCSTIKNGSRPGGNENNVQPRIHMTLFVLVQNLFLVALASSLPGLEFASGWSKFVQRRAFNPPFGHTIDVRPSRMGPAQVGNAKDVRKGFI